MPQVAREGVEVFLRRDDAEREVESLRVPTPRAAVSPPKRVVTTYASSKSERRGTVTSVLRPTLTRLAVAVAVMALIGLAFALNANSQYYEEGQCRGVMATIVGTPGPDQLVGTPARDVIAADGGADQILAGGGNDLICAGVGNDQVMGGPGPDRIFGGRGSDQLQGNAGDDRVFGQRGSDQLQGNAGDDSLFGQTGNDELQGNGGDDLLGGGRGFDLGDGGRGADVCFGVERTRSCRRA
ncbi:MAG: hypothetical protein M3327_15300 [Actinomycetota bacterium]|nr:hypothetical protein [Actinomycetota bacterium]